MAGFLDLPRELRDEIYTYYAIQDGGYVYNQRTRRLRAANGGPIHVSLMQTCNQVAHELRPIIFESNTVTFRTGWVDRETSDRAASFASAQAIVHKTLSTALYHALKSIPDDMIDRAGMVFPQCVPMIRLIAGTPIKPDTPISRRIFFVQGWRSFRCPPSTHREFVQFMLSLGKGTKRWWEYWKEDEILGERTRDGDIKSLLHRSPDPWIIPDEDDIAFLKEKCQPWPMGKTIFVPGHDRHPIKRYFSAAALAIQFLGSLDSNLLSAIRHIELDEVHASVAHPECHGLGLVNIMQQYPGISINRRVDTRSLIMTRKRYNESIEYIEDFVDRYLDGEDFDNLGRLESVHVSQAFMPWFEESVALSSHLPPDRFSITFYSENDEVTLAMLSRVIEDSVWQRKLEQLTTRPSHAARFLDCVCFFSESFTPVVRAIQRGKGNISFDIGDLEIPDQDVEQILREADRNMKPRSVAYEWLYTLRKYVEPQPFSDWEDMLDEYIEEGPREFA